MSDAEENGWYYNLDTHQAEQGKQGWVGNRMGPYPDKATAERALEIARERNKRADDDD
ncbi:hypothetical protein [Nocardia jejuensis]|uniref:hypothetical protein n=1 Tax=Nocardia jejuensis TaxID=328049 RepID=UPI000A76A15A|nr:hypothetical protein [Nocardia jejuensis]